MRATNESTSIRILSGPVGNSSTAIAMSVTSAPLASRWRAVDRLTAVPNATKTASWAHAAARWMVLDSSCSMSGSSSVDDAFLSSLSHLQPGDRQQ